MLRKIARQTWTTTLRILLILLVLMTLALVVAFGTEGGRITVVKQSLQLINVATANDIELKGIRSPSMRQWRVEQVLIRDADNQPKLRVRDLQIDWNWRYALQHRWWFNQIQLDALTVYKSTGESNATPAETLAELYRAWPQIPAVRIDAVSVDQLRIEHTELPPFQSELSGQLELNWGAIPARFLLALTDNLNGNYFAAELSADAIDYFRLSGSLSANAGSAWSQWLQWDLSEPVDARWSLRIDYSEPGFLSVLIDDWAMPWKSHQITSSGELKYDIEQAQMQFLPLNVELDEKPASLDGWISHDNADLSVTVIEWNIEPFAEFIGVSDLQGQASVKARVQGGWRRPLVDAQLDASGQWRQQPFDLQVTSSRTAQKVTLKQAELTLANNQISATGVVDWITDELELSYNAELSTDPVFRSVLPAALAGVQASGTLSGEITGAIENPSVTADARLEGFWQQDAMQANIQALWQDGTLALSDVSLNLPVLKTQGDLTWQVADNRWNARLDIAEWHTDIFDRLNINFPVTVDGAGDGQLNISGVGEQFSIAGLLNFNGVWQRWPIEAEVNLDEINARHIRFSDSRIKLASSQLIANGGVDWSAQELDLHLDHTQLPLDVLPQWFPVWPSILQTLHGNMTGHTDVTGPWTRPAVATESKFVGRWFDEYLELDLAVEPTTNLEWNITKFDASWLTGRWQYTGLFEPYALQLDGRVQADSINNRYLPLLTREFTGNERQLPENMDLDFSADMAISGSIVEPVLVGNLSSRGQIDQQPFVLDADLNYLDTHHMVISEAQGVWAAGDWVLSGRYDWHDNEIIMTIETNTPDAKHLVPWVQLVVGTDPNFRWLDAWQGSLNGTLQLDNRFDSWKVQGELDSQGLLQQQPYELRWLGEGELQTQLNHQFEGEWGDASISASLISGNQLLTGNVDVTALQFAQIDLFVDIFPDQMSGELNADILLSGEVSKPTVNAQINARGRYLAHDFTSGLLLQSDADGWRISDTNVAIPGALTLTVAGEGKDTNGTVRLVADFTDTRYWWPDSALGNGQARVELTASGDLTAPDLNGRLNWQTSSWPISLQSTLVTKNNEYQLEASLLSRGQVRVKAGAKSPVASLSSWKDELLSKPMEMRLAVNTPLTVLDPFFINQPDQKVSGTLGGDITLTGSLNNPYLDGEIAWIKGAYEHASYGTRISDIGLVLHAEDKQLKVSGSATDAANGLMLIAGTVDFFQSESDMLAHAISVTASLDNAKLINQAQMDAILSGDIKVIGSYHSLLVSGDLVVPQFNMQTDTLLWDGAPQLNIVTAEQYGDDLNTQRFYWPQGEWDVTLQADQRANLYGQGINAELSGEFSVSGDLYNPVLAGQFELVRGTYVGFGKVFTLTEGQVQLQNNLITLDIQGEYSSDDLDVTLEITGNQNELSLSLTSDTTDGQDELLALLLFGESIEEMSVVQAIQLANALNKLRTGDSGLDIVAQARDDLSLDTLVIDTDSDDDGNLTFNVSAGKYINDFLYLEIEQGVGSDQEFRSSLQYKLTKKVYLEFYTQGEFGQFDENGIELNWSWDY